MDEVWKSIRAHMYTRTSSPLAGAFLASWAIWNYKLLFVLFLSGIPVIERFAYVDTVHFVCFQDGIRQGFAYPLISACLVILLYPIPATLVYWYTGLSQNVLKKIRQKIEDESPMTLAQSRELRRDMFKLKIEHGNEIAKANVEISAKESIIEELQQNLEKEETNANRSLESMSDEELEETASAAVGSNNSDNLRSEDLKALMILVELGGEVDEDILYSRIPFHHIQAKHYIDRLQEMGLVKRDYNQQEGIIEVTLTPAGRGAAVKHDLIPDGKN